MGVTIEGDVVGAGMRFAIIKTRWNEFIVDHLCTGATDALRRHGVDQADVDLIIAPGAYEIPLIARKLAETKRYDAVIALGCVIRGATAHFEYVAGEAASGLSSVSAATGTPVIFGVLTTETIEQAIERAGTKAGNKGAEAAIAAIEMASLCRKLTD